MTTDGGASDTRVAVLGLAAQQPRFVAESGDWDPAAYLPAFVRRYPCRISKLSVDGAPRGDKVVCVARSYVDPGAIALFDAAGSPSQYWKGIDPLLAQYEKDLDRTAELCAALARLDLFSPYSLRGVQDDDATLSLEGMHRVDASRFEALRPASHKALLAKRFADRIYAHLRLLENFRRLYQRAVTRMSSGQRGWARPRPDPGPSDREGRAAPMRDAEKPVQVHQHPGGAIASRRAQPWGGSDREAAARDAVG